MIRVIFFFGILLSGYTGYTQYETRIVVALDGSGDYPTIQLAILATKAFPDQDITIFIKNGIYREKVTVFAWNTNLTLQGESRDSTIIQWDDYFAKLDLGRNSTFHTYTMKVEGNDVALKDLTIQNTAGPVGQAVALHVDADRVVVSNCIIQGHQDTLYAAGENNRQFYHNCRISGTTDFIFGSATAVFSNCTLESFSNSYITAASTSSASPYGMVFLDCNLIKSDTSVNQVYLGRPWRAYAKTVFINCHMESHILPAGWANWNDEKNEETAFYAEYGSFGPGGNTTQRVGWAHQLSKKQVDYYTLKRILRDWHPSAK